MVKPTTAHPRHMGAGKTFQIYMPGDLVDSFRQRADDEARGNESGYVQDLHRAHLDSTPSKNRENTSAIVDLARVFHPTLVSTLEHQLAQNPHSARPVNQPRVIARFLEALTAALDGKFDAESEISLVDKGTALAWQQLSDENLASAAQHLAALLNSSGKTRLGAMLSSSMLNESRETYLSRETPDVGLEREKRRRAAAKAKTAAARAKTPRTDREENPAKK